VQHAAAEIEGRFDRVGDAAAGFCIDFHPVDDRFHQVLPFVVDLRDLFDLVRPAVDPHPEEALRPQAVPEFRIALADGDLHRRRQVQPRSRFERQDAVDDLVGRLAQIVGVIVLGVMATSLSGMVAAFSIGAGVALLVHQWLSPVPWPKFRISWPAWQKLMSVSWPLGAMLVISAVYFRIDTVMLSIFRPADEVGWYGLAYRVVESTLFIPAMFGGLLLPRISESLKQKNIKQASRYLSEGVQFLFLIAAFAVITLIIKSQAVTLIISDSSFLPAAPLLTILGLAMGIIFFGNLFGFALVALQRQRQLLKL
jgi:O-antigen/teichoic acid export membrane protein